MVDLVIGRHAHVVQRIERIGAMGRVPARHLFQLPAPDGVWGAASRDGLVVEIVVQRGNNATVSIEAPIARPVWVDRDAGWWCVTLPSRSPTLSRRRLGQEFEQSWGRKAAVVGDFSCAR